MVTAYVYIEGGGDSKELHVRCREGFRRLLERCGLSGRLPRLVACGSRSETYDSFRTRHVQLAGQPAYVAMIVDSEEPVSDIERVWNHLEHRDHWARPAGSDDEQAFLMVTCMETWIISDRNTLQTHYGSGLQNSALPSLTNMESRLKLEIQSALEQATRRCSNAYRKGKRSFEILGKLDPTGLSPHLPSFTRFQRILNAKL